MHKDYSKVEHIKLIADIIKRMANNHMKWLFSLFTIIAFGITIDKFFLEIPNKFEKIIALVTSAILIFTIEVIALRTSWRFLKLETTYRKKQNEVIQNKWNEYNMTPVLKAQEKKKYKISWIIKVGIVLILLSVIMNVAFVIMAFFL
ncbi:MAG: hypothetical protein GY679_03310 [Mycoplasma sp.]|nr:hypothetical protein [Mycoplasma sp.]